MLRTGTQAGLVPGFFVQHFSEILMPVLYLIAILLKAFLPIAPMNHKKLITLLRGEAQLLLEVCQPTNESAKASATEPANEPAK